MHGRASTHVTQLTGHSITSPAHTRHVWQSQYWLSCTQLSACVTYVWFLLNLDSEEARSERVDDDEYICELSFEDGSSVVSPVLTPNNVDLVVAKVTDLVKMECYKVLTQGFCLSLSLSLPLFPPLSLLNTSIHFTSPSLSHTSI